MAEPNFTINLNRRLAAATACAIGDLLVPDANGYYVVATSANRSGGKRTEAIALSAYSGTGVGRVHIQQAGTIANSISELGSGSQSWVRASSTGQPERVATPGASDDIIGRCEADGSIHLAFGILNSTLTNGGTAAGSSGDIQTNSSGAFGALGEWTSPSSGRLNATSSGYLSYGTTGDTLPAPGSTSGGLIRLGSSVGTGGSPWGILQWYHAGSSSHYNLLTVQDNGSGVAATFNIGSRYSGAGQWLNTVINGDDVSLVADDGGGTFKLAGSNSVGADRQGALASYRLAIGTTGGGNDATFGGSAAGPMLKLHEIVTTPTGNPTGSASAAVWIYFEDATNDTVKIHFPSGNKLILPDHDAAVATNRASVAMGALDVDWSAGDVFTKTLSSGGNTITFSNDASGRVIVVVLTGSSSTVTWPAAVQWTGGTEPTQTASGTDVYTFVRAGSTIYGSVVQSMS